MKYLAVALTLLALTSGSAWAGGDHGLLSMKTLEKLDLSQEQREKLESIRQAAKEEYKASKTEIRKLRKELREKLVSDSSSEDLRALYQELEEKRAAKHEQKFNRMLEVREILTPDQRAELMKIGKEHHRKNKDCDRRGDRKAGD